MRTMTPGFRAVLSSGYARNKALASLSKPRRYQVHVWTRSPVTGLSEWKAIRPAGSERPYLFTFEEARRQRKNMTAAGHPEAVRIVEA